MSQDKDVFIEEPLRLFKVDYAIVRQVSVDADRVYNPERNSRTIVVQVP